MICRLDLGVLEAIVERQPGLCFTRRHAEVDPALNDLLVVGATASTCVDDVPDVQAQADTGRGDRIPPSRR